MNTKKGLSYYMSNYGILIGFIAICVILSIATPTFLSVSNITTVLKQTSCIGIASIGVGLLIIMNCIDLSIGSMFALNGVVAGLVVSTGLGGYGLPAWVGIVAGIAAGTLFSGVTGIIVAKGRIPAFIVTLGTQSIARGLALILAHGMPVGSFPDSFSYIGTENLFGFFPWLVVIYIAVIVIMNFVMKKRPFGRYLYAVGGNEEAAKVAGINVDKVKIQAYLIEGLLIGLASVMMASRLKSASPQLGTGYEGDAIAGCIIGGVSFTGGIGTIFDMVLGALIIGVINNGMDLLGVSAFYKYVVKGSIIILAVLVDRKRAGRG